MTAIEIAMKRRKFGERFGFTVMDLDLAMRNLRCDELPLTIRQQRKFSEIPLLHQDPFDHLLMLQAMTERIPLMTLD